MKVERWKVRHRRINGSPISNTTIDRPALASVFNGEAEKMEHAWIAGQPAALDAAIEGAAKLLASSRCPLIAGLGTDVAGARAAIRLAERIGAVVDHMNSDALLRDLDVMRSSGMLMTTPTEAHVRADTLLLVGPGLGEAWQQLPPHLFAALRQGESGSSVGRQIYCLCPAGNWPIPGSAVVVNGQGREIPILLAALRARLAGRPIGKTRVPSSKLDQIATALKAARFGVAVWSAAAVDALTIEMLCGLLNDLNATTRFSGLPLAPSDNAVGVAQTCTWMTGLPVRTGFARAVPEHDPWLFDGRRMVSGGEADCLLWLSAYRALAPPWRTKSPTIVLTTRDTNFDTPPRVHISVGHPGVDHASVEYQSSTGTLAPVEAKRPSDAISVADVMARIMAALPPMRELAC
jgi:formylmethanofuran dehydrogenase subunit B